MVICLECAGNDLHMVHLMPLPPVISCFIKIQIGLSFVEPVYPGCRGKEAVKQVWCVTGESVDDCGGGYSESIAEMRDELQNGSRCDV